MGQLTLSSAQKLAQTLKHTQVRPLSIGSAAASSPPKQSFASIAGIATSVKNFVPLAAPGHSRSPSLPSPNATIAPRASWKPSGGKQIENNGLSIVLENAAAGFQRPNILDLKLGARLWDDDAPVAKRARLDKIARESTSGSLGFRIAGMKIWHGDDSPSNGTNGNIPLEHSEHVSDKAGFRAYDKNYGRIFKGEEDIKVAFRAYLGLDCKNSEALQRRKLVAKRIARELESVVYMLEHEESRMYSASILAVFEGDDEALQKAVRNEEEREERGQEDWEPVEDEDGEVHPYKVHDVRLIDFAHATFVPGQGPDENALRGVRSALKIFKDLSN